ncbi:MAG TPA: hypothetical protein PL131_03520 [Methylotenera sp.]|nr:hypothetical protein [Methylotenera sp.]HPH04919.1 hypothetical protein [Methylotenera sp.]HPN01757.1 hypothetical protein [Methylotenera sp.]
MTRRLTELDVKKNQFEKQLAAQTSYIQDVEPFLPRALDTYKNMVQNLPEACKEHAAPVREKLSKLLGGKVSLRRTEHGGWEGSYQGSYSGLIRLGTSPLEISDETLCLLFYFVLNNLSF